MILSAQSIRERGIITPFNERTAHNGMSYGLGVAGYDVRVEFGVGRILRFCNEPVQRSFFFSKHSAVIGYEEPHTFALAATIEHFEMPDDVLGHVADKSTWARRGLAVQNTIIEPGWRGHLTLELTFHGTGELIIQEGDPIAQIIFHQLDRPTEKPYCGKYQDQERGPQEARSE